MIRKKGELEVRRPEDETTLPGVWRSFHEFDRVFDDLRRQMDEAFGGWTLPGLAAWPSRDERLSRVSAWRTPRVNIADLDDRYEVAAEIPGVPKEGIEVDVSDDRLEIRAERSLERSEEKDGAQYREIGRSAFYRVLPLPHDADGDKVEAKLDHGVLTVTLPKVEARAPKKRVAVK